MTNTEFRNKNIELLVSKIFSDEDLFLKFANINDIDELYDFCLTVQDGYSKEEFQKWALDMYLLAQGIDSDQLDAMGRLNESDALEGVSGGRGIIPKIVSGGLAALSLATATLPGFQSGVSAHEQPVTTSATVTHEARERRKIRKKKVQVQETTEKKSKTGAIKRLWGWIKTHPYKTAAAAIGTVVAIGVIVGGGKYAVGAAKDKYKNYQTEKKQKEAGTKAKELGRELVYLKDNTHEEEKKRDNAWAAFKAASKIDESKLIKLEPTDHRESKKERQARLSENDRKLREAVERAHNEANRIAEEKKRNPNYEFKDGEEAIYNSYTAYKAAADAVTSGEKQIAEHEKDKKFYDDLSKPIEDPKMKKDWKDSIGPFGAAVGLVGTGFNGLLKFITWTSQRAKEVHEIGRTGTEVKYTLQDFNRKLELEEQARLNSPMDYKEGKKILEEELSKVQGQESAKTEIRKFYDSYMNEVQKAQHDGKTMNHAMIIKLNGPSGVGKTMCANALSKALSHADPFTRNSSSILPSSDPVKLIEQVIGERNYWDFDSSGKSRSEPDLMSYIEKNEGKTKVLFLDEYDKYVPVDFPGNHPLDETFRGLHDCEKGKFKFANGKTADISGGMVVIMSTNESKGSVNAKTYWDKKRGQLVDPINDDKTGSCTVLRHDSSFECSRVIHAQFDELSRKAYKDIILDHTDDHMDYYYDTYGIDLEITDKSYEKATDYVVDQHRGARPIDKSLIPSLANAVMNLKTRLDEEKLFPDDASKKVQKPTGDEPWYAVYSKTKNEWTILPNAPENEDDENGEKSALTTEEQEDKMSEEMHKKYLKDGLEMLKDSYGLTDEQMGEVLKEIPVEKVLKDVPTFG